MTSEHTTETDPERTSRKLGGDAPARNEQGRNGDHLPTNEPGEDGERRPPTERRSSGRADPLLRVAGLETHIETPEGVLHAVDGVSFSVAPGETVCVVGESGSGKSVTCRSITRLVPTPPIEIVDGVVEFDGESLLDAEESTLRRIRGNRVASVFQNPQGALDPVFTVGDQIVEAIRFHESIDWEDARRRAARLLSRVGIPRSVDRLDDYPHEFSGGMQQRVAIAIALAADPDLIVADEPTTAVDATVQARIIDRFRELAAEGTALLLVTHDLRVVSALADRVVVMFGGTVVERGPVETVFDEPAHPYTQALFESHGASSTRDGSTARGEVPTDGCRFRAQCPHAVDACAGGDQPTFHALAANHEVSCVHFGPEGDPEPVLANAAGASPTGGDDE